MYENLFSMVCRGSHIIHSQKSRVHIRMGVFLNEYLIYRLTMQYLPPQSNNIGMADLNTCNLIVISIKLLTLPVELMQPIKI